MKGWLIIYLRADHDAFTQSRDIGIEYNKTLRYSKKDSVDAMRELLQEKLEITVQE